MPLSAGGDHLITLPIMRGIAKGQAPLGMVHFDAHSDTWDTYFGGYKYTHGTPFRRAVEEGLLDPRRVVQIGIRGSLYKRDDNDWAVEQGMRVITIEEYFDLGVDKVIAEARRVVGDGPTYVSFDVDGLDPAYAPGTGTPEIGGYTTHEAQRMLRGLRGLEPGRRRRGRGLAAVRHERQHRAGRRHDDVGDPLPARRGGGEEERATLARFARPEAQPQLGQPARFGQQLARLRRIGDALAHDIRQRPILGLAATDDLEAVGRPEALGQLPGDTRRRNS